jgi:ABC-type lipopolysaccharide export system ATPase subunit
METFYKVEYNGIPYLEKDPSIVRDILVDMDVDVTYRITKIQMTIDEYEDLKEFDRF